MRYRILLSSLAAIIIAVVSPLTLLAQPSPLTVQPSTGNVGIGTNNPAYRFEVRGGTFFLGQRADGCCAALLMGVGETHLYAFSSGRFGIHKYGGSVNGEVFSILPDGKVGIGLNATAPTQALHVIGDAYKTVGGTTWATSSDIRLKNVLGSYDAGLSEILALGPVRFRYKKDNILGLSDEKDQVGLVAQEVKAVIPEAISEDSRGYLALHSDPVIWAMLNAIKTQQGQIEELKAEVERLSGKVRLAEAGVGER